jgi:hypothetical protein
VNVGLSPIATRSFSVAAWAAAIAGNSASEHR